MRIAPVLGPLLVLMALALPGKALADRRDFDVINNTPWEIFYVYVRVSGTQDWGDDVMEEDVLGPSKSVHIHFTSGSLCPHDIRIRYRNGVDKFWSNINLCSISKFRIWFDFAKDSYQANWE